MSAKHPGSGIAITHLGQLPMKRSSRATYALPLLLASLLPSHSLAQVAPSRVEEFTAATRAARIANQTAEPLAPGPFAPTWNSLRAYETPEWFRDAKFGIWAHWSPQGQPEMSDWYARFLYMPTGRPAWAKDIYHFHTVRYGHPSKRGYKDVARTFKAPRWQPRELVELYKRAGARYFVALANHHDNFDLWDSKYQPWNSTLVGPRRDMIAEWAAAARASGLRFGVSMHAARAWTWFEVAQGADLGGPLAGVPYDGKLTAQDGAGLWWEGLDPQDLYAQNHPLGAPYSADYKRKFTNRVFDAINKYNPDLLYFDDGVMPYYAEDGEASLTVAAHLYNHSVATHGGANEAVLATKRLDEDQRKCLVYDIERGRAETILPEPWQTDTCIGEWHYSAPSYEAGKYQSAHAVLQMLIDIVSKNGNLLLSIPVRADGTHDELELAILDDLAAWMTVNHACIVATRPWKVYGEGPSTEAPQEEGGHGGIKDVAEYAAGDVRFTTSKDGKTLYAILMAPAAGDVHIKSLASELKLLDPGVEISAVELLGSEGPLDWSQEADALTVKSCFTEAPANPAVLKVTLTLP